MKMKEFGPRGRTPLEPPWIRNWFTQLKILARVRAVLERDKLNLHKYDSL